MTGVLASIGVTKERRLCGVSLVAPLLQLDELVHEVFLVEDGGAHTGADPLLLARRAA